MTTDSNLNDHIRVDEIAQDLSLLEKEIQKDQAKLKEINTPLSLMRVRAIKAESALKVSDKALEALKIVQDNSLEIIRAGEVVIASMKATIKENDDDAVHKQVVLEGLKTIIEKNRVSLEASALAFNAVHELAFTDPLTGLPNRRLLEDRLTQIIFGNKRWDAFSAAIFLDLDKFKRLNDEFGHDAGDELLIAVGNRLKACVRESDTVARYGGDEFVVLLDRLDGNLVDARHQAEAIANKILTALNPTYSLQVHDNKGVAKSIEYQIFASLGVAMIDGNMENKGSILDWADEAMYWAKNDGGRTVRFYDAVNSTEQTLNRLYNMATENDIETDKHGLRTRQFVKSLGRRAQQMNLYPNKLSDQVIERFFKITQLHDIGKTRIPYAIIHKQGQLSFEEWAIIKTHTTLGGWILREAKKQNASLNDFLDAAIDMAESHHERWDGSGYPKGLVGDAIPLVGRIMGIADVYDALVSKRPYKEPWNHEDACAEIISQSAQQFDPFLIEAFKREQDNFRLISEANRD